MAKGVAPILARFIPAPVVVAPPSIASEPLDEAGPVERGCGKAGLRPISAERRAKLVPRAAALADLGVAAAIVMPSPAPAMFALLIPCTLRLRFEQYVNRPTLASSQGVTIAASQGRHRR